MFKSQSRYVKTIFFKRNFKIFSRKKLLHLPNSPVKPYILRLKNMYVFQQNKSIVNTYNVILIYLIQTSN